MTDDAMNASNLDICKQDVVFQHFPMHRLRENPGTWTVMKYKYGRLIVPDSNKVDWIYVIKSGEARVYKYLSPGPVDVKARRKKVQTMLNEQSPFYRRKQMLDFIEDRDYIKSSYKPGSYHPAMRAGAKSAPPGKARDVRFNAHKIAAAFASLPITPQTGVVTKPEVRLDTRLPQIILTEEDEDNNSKCSNDSDEHKESDNCLNLTDLPEGAVGYLNRDRRPSIGLGLGIPMRNRSGSFMRTPMTSRAKPEQFVKVGRTTFPAFVHVETLHPGHTFGLRACLDADEMGPSVSLVSGDCEVLQINRKYFMKHCDDALYSLIRLKAKRFPSQEDLIDRLDANIQWEEFKQLTLDTFLQQYRDKKQIF
ncbi:uncharacterized protein LOC126830617 [Patella vulgata]|uniref:uncharacterized protein LOC126830617 n=1 Tax=Patella vulgata TaxID=6465 RepID=UPI00217FCEB4|nr:uncharacterized protein LOC126830617 [Patella vulgata]